jgi:transcriptional regulator with XRE-family HTH domain
MKNATSSSVKTARARGERLRDLRMKRGLTQIELAARSGAGVTTIFRIEKTGTLTDRTAQLLARALGVRVTEILK